MLRVLILIGLFLFSIPAQSQRSTSSNWEEDARADPGLLPKYGSKQRTPEQKEEDTKFVNTTLTRLEYEGNRQEASADWIKLGFNALGKKDPRAAMHLFNKAWLLDSTNNDVYWGYGGVYMSIGNYENAREQYLYGLKRNPKHAAMLADYSGYFMAQFYGLQSLDPKGAVGNLDSALKYLHSSYQIDPKEANTCFKLSACYMLKAKCGEAWRYFQECENLGGAGITEEFRAELQGRCPQK